MSVNVSSRYDAIVPVDGATVSIATSCGSASPSYGTTTTAGYLSTVYTAPVVSSATTCMINVNATKAGYLKGYGVRQITVNPPSTPSPTPNVTYTPTPTYYPTATPTPTYYPTYTPVPTATPTVTAAPAHDVGVLSLNVPRTVYVSQSFNATGYAKNHGSVNENVTIRANVYTASAGYVPSSQINRAVQTMAIAPGEMRQFNTAHFVDASTPSGDYLLSVDAEVPGDANSMNDQITVPFTVARQQATATPTYYPTYTPVPTATVTVTAIPAPTIPPRACTYPYQCIDAEKAKVLGCAQVPDAVCPQLVATGTDTAYPALQMNCYKCPLPTATVTAYPTATPITCEEKCKQAYGKDEAGAVNCIERECRKTPAAIIHMARGFGIAGDYNVLVLAVKLLPNARGFGAMKFAGRKYKLSNADYSGDTFTAKVFYAGSEVGSIKVRIEERDGVATASGSLTLRVSGAADNQYRVYLFRYVRGYGSAAASTPANAWAVLPSLG
jgi:hypothetical protein